MPINPEKTPWTPDLTAALRKLWAEGKSAGEIRTILGSGLTRNAVIGKVHRLRLPGRPNPQGLVNSGSFKSKSDTKPKKQSKRVTLPAMPINRPEIAADALPPRSEAFLVLPGAPEPKPLHDLALRGECHWPIGENPTLFCGCKTEATYCPTHAAMAYRPRLKETDGRRNNRHKRPAPKFIGDAL